MPGTEYFPAERLIVHRRSCEFRLLVEQRLGSAKLRRHVRDQLERAALSIQLNVAEGAGEYRPKEKARFYRMAKRSAAECAALLDVLNDRPTVASAVLREARSLLAEILAMLTTMLRKLEARQE